MGDKRVGIYVTVLIKSGLLSFTILLEACVTATILDRFR